MNKNLSIKLRTSGIAPIIILMIVGVLAVGGAIFYLVQKDKGGKPLSYIPEEACDKAGGYFCQGHEVCEGGLSIDLKETERCCLVKCQGPTQFEFSSKRYCDKDPESGKFNRCSCEPKEEKNKVAIVIAQGGIFDSGKINSDILEYYTAVKKDLNIENVGLKKFEGKTVGDLDKFIDDLYLNDNVGYVILVGDDLPVANISEANMENLAAIHEKLECVKKDCWECLDKEHCFSACKDVAISYILPPVLYSDNEKINFISEIFKTYTNYHKDFDSYIGKYQKSVLHVGDPEGFTGNPLLGYDLPVVAIQNIEYKKVTEEFKKKYIILHIGGHGATTILGMGIANKQYPTLEDYLNFTKENGVPALFVDSGACQAVTIKDFEIGLKHCCWPQVFMESGVWTYYAITREQETLKNFPKEETIGLAIRKGVIGQNFVFGDILAHMK